jgi:hypothetical protein
MAAPGSGDFDIRETLWDSQFNTLFIQPKIAFKGDMTVTTSATTVTHDLGYIPHVQVWAEQLSGEITVPILISGYTSYHSRYLSSPNLLWYVTSSTVVFQASSGSLKTYYRIYTI